MVYRKLGLLIGWVGVFGLQACASYPLGIDKDTWERMTPAEQHQAYQKQAQLRAEREERQRQHEAELARQKQQAMDHAGFGDKLQCVIREGQMTMGKEQYPITPKGFVLLRGYEEVIDLDYQRKRAIYTAQSALIVRFDGMQVSFCETSYSRNCPVLVATTREFSRGVTGMIQTSQFSAQISCELQADQRSIRDRYYRQ
ncbi:hypothetical protein JX580_06155 [Thiomicrospira microaerophila]|uniref:hypothetical protein n=1 Tax=Thiomicrospira microaerophila TaxID=406020 RepID=UPI00200FA35E|nr:hypothetical protein [Thiomicrospira microaerophila]UQB41286.1 hypothetical protein JX580_06155 [Thiomicrospira microaerophila]